jgi:CheY-specific phosphatase CheX
MATTSRRPPADAAAAALLAAGATAFEELGFLFVAPELPEGRARAAGVVASVAFRGPFDGSLVVEMDGSLLAPLAENMLGDEEAPSPAMQDDAFGELANVICGHTLTRLAGARASFRLAAPRVHGSGEEVEGRQAVGGPRAALAQVTLPLEAGWARLTLLLDEQPSAERAAP